MHRKTNDLIWYLPLFESDCNMIKNKKKVIVLGANPAWQKTLFFHNLNAGKVNRAYHEENYPSGKGVNFCRALRYSKLAETLLLQFAGGNNGKLLCDGLDAAGFQHQTVFTGSETRNCITCLDDSGNMTELIGVSHKILPDEANAMLDKLRSVLPCSGILAITGSLPDGSDPQLYGKAAKLAMEHRVPILVDALIGLPEVLSQNGTVILKVNREEFFKITGESEIFQAHRKAEKSYPGKVFAVTNGGENATLSYNNILFEYILPPVKVVNPLGSGDTASAVMSALCAERKPFQEAFRQALAAASANCTTAKAGEYDPDCANDLAQQMQIIQHNL